MARSTSLLSFLALGLACSGLLDPGAELLEVDRRVAEDAGYTLPGDATAISIRDKSSGSGRSTWFLYTLPHDAWDELLAELRNAPEVLKAEDATVPEDWPEVATLGFEAPPWWAPSGHVFRREIPAGSVERVPSGRMWALTDEGQVYVWMWTRKGWRFQPDRPVLGD